MANDDNEVRKKGSNQKHNAELQKKKLGLNLLIVFLIQQKIFFFLK